MDFNRGLRFADDRKDFPIYGGLGRLCKVLIFRYLPYFRFRFLQSDRLQVQRPVC